LIREGEGIAAGVLESLGVNLQKVRREVMRVLTYPGTVPTRDVADSGLGLVRTSERDSSGRPLLWDYLLIPTFAFGRSIEVEPFYSRNPLPYDLAGMKIAHVLDLLGDDGWELVAVDPRHQAEKGQGRLYIFKRPRQIEPPSAGEAESEQ
jgi:Clp amino terminal domain, pathogenicity island component